MLKLIQIQFQIDSIEIQENLMKQKLKKITIKCVDLKKKLKDLEKLLV